METFIVRIYRRDPAAADEPVGTVECVGSGERQGFAGREELWDRLCPADAQMREAPEWKGETKP